MFKYRQSTNDDTKWRRFNTPYTTTNLYLIDTVGPYAIAPFDGFQTPGSSNTDNVWTYEDDPMTKHQLLGYGTSAPLFHTFFLKKADFPDNTYDSVNYLSENVSLGKLPISYMTDNVLINKFYTSLRSLYKHES